MVELDRRLQKSWIRILLASYANLLDYLSCFVLILKKYNYVQREEKKTSTYVRIYWKNFCRPSIHLHFFSKTTLWIYVAHIIALLFLYLLFPNWSINLAAVILWKMLGLRDFGIFEAILADLQNLTAAQIFHRFEHKICQKKRNLRVFGLTLQKRKERWELNACSGSDTVRPFRAKKMRSRSRCNW